MRALIVIGFSGLSCLALPNPCAATVFHFWIKSFIPNEHPKINNYFKVTSKGTSVLPAPSVQLPIADISKLTDTCFATDNRGFDKSPLASARVTTEMTLVIDERKVSVEKFNGRDMVRIGQTENVDCKSGEQLSPPRATSPDTVSISGVKQQNFIYVVNIKASASNPFYKLLGVQMAPDIDYEVVIQYSVLTKSINVDIVTGYFPSFEAYYTLDDGPVTTIINWPPYENSTAASLFNLGLGINTRSVKYKIKLQ
ncbi:MAG TPA: DUF3238 domain-containing protein [Marinagarivorans sp.]|nr:DUF3238 domain-containing protein [Marinagarivorans sp.]HNG61645.1 DUF3238 domain-containing protein [Cellvibrionaceae bacterium]